MSSLSSSSKNHKSKSTSKSNNPIQLWTYDVFLIFHDKGIRKSFASHLYSTLTREAGFRVFMADYEGRSEEDHTNSSVMQAIKESRSSIIVFSSNFVPSTWFLKEMEYIMECRRTIAQLVMPVFYDVDPSDVRHQKGMWGEAFEDLAHSTLMKDEQMRYRAALTEAASISRYCIARSWNGDRDANNIVKTLTHLIEVSYLFVAENPVGVEARVQDVIQLLNSKQQEHTIIVGIWGISGIGKTTIAKAIYNQMGCSFEGKSFLLNVAEIWEQSRGQVSLLQQLLSDIFGITQLNSDTVESTKMILRKRLRYRRIFLVLDDVNKLHQLKALCGSRECFGLGSRIIITTRDRHIFHDLPIDHVYRMKDMNNIESLELFSWHAFNLPSPIENYVNLCIDAVEHCGGLPLALQLTGSFLRGRSVIQWMSALKKFKTTPQRSTMKLLRTNFDDLNDNEKEIFLNIASVLIGMEKDEVIQILTDSGCFQDTGIKVLEDKSLVTVDSKNRIEMHTLLQAMGREIIRQQQPKGVAETKMYEVFLSFRGKDCRTTFISHLYSTLQNAGIYVFKDNEGIERGEKIKVSLLRAIGRSKISIVVLSTNFANSKWCLLELERILEVSSINSSMVVLPVFYEVDATDVRHQTGEFGKAFESLISTVSVDEYTERNWKAALREIGDMAGISVKKSRDESEDCNKIVAVATHLLDKKELFVADHPVGVESRVQDVIQLLNIQHSKGPPLLLGICGIGGTGKTTIAKAVYNKIRHDFEASSFLFNVRDAWKLDSDKVSLQQQLLSDIYKTTKIKIDKVESGKLQLKERLSKKKIFVVIDDVNKLDQLDALCGGRDWFGEGSRIIITTKDVVLLSKVDHEYKMKLMDSKESHQFFSWHAFKQSTPKKGFKNLSRDVVKYSGGLPLALQVTGSFLSTRRTKAEWKSVLEKLKMIPNDQVLEKLKISFDSLSDDDLRDIFLDIAFFFIGMDREDVTKILEDCGHFPGIGITVLLEQSLVTVDKENKIGMHNLLRDMGRHIVHRKSKEGGKEPSRLWRYEDVCGLLRNTSTLDVKGVTLKMPIMDSTTSLETKAFEKMDKLRLLQLSGLQLVGDYKYLSRDLRWLCWDGFPSKFTPADIFQESLVSIELKYSNLQQVLRKSQLLKNLKILNLSHSHNLRHTPDFSNCPNLEKLILEDCPKLSSVSPNIGHLRKILLINLKDCKGLCELPKSIYELDSIKTLILSGCTKMKNLEAEIERMKSLTTLFADNTGINRVPLAIVRLKKLGYIALCGYEGSAPRLFPAIVQFWLSPKNNISSLVQTSAATSCLLSIIEDVQNLQRLWLTCASEAQLNQMVASILDSFNTPNWEGFSNNGTSASIQCRSHLLIEIGMSCNVANILRERILQKRAPIGSGLLPGDNYPNWLTFNSNDSFVTFEVPPQVDGRNLKKIMCLVYSYSPDNTTTEGLKVLLVINYTKNTIHVYKRDALLVSPGEEEWRRVISNIEPGNEIKVVVVSTNELTVKKTTIYLVYDEPIDVKTKHEPDENVIGSSGNFNLDHIVAEKDGKGKNKRSAAESFKDHSPYEIFVKKEESSSSMLLQDSIKGARKKSASAARVKTPKKAKKLKVLKDPLETTMNPTSSSTTVKGQSKQEPNSEPGTTPFVVSSEPTLNKPLTKSISDTKPSAPLPKSVSVTETYVPTPSQPSPIPQQPSQHPPQPQPKNQPEIDFTIPPMPSVDTLSPDNNSSSNSAQESLVHAVTPIDVVVPQDDIAIAASIANEIRLLVQSSFSSKAHSKSADEPNQNYPPNSPIDIDSPIQTPFAEPRPLYHSIPLPKHNLVFLQNLPNTVDHDLYWHRVYAVIKEEYKAEHLAWNRNDEYYERVLHLLLELQEANEKLVNRRYMKRIMAKMNKKQEEINNRILFEIKWEKVLPLVENFIKEREEKAKIIYTTPIVELPLHPEDYGTAVPCALKPRLVDSNASTLQYVTINELQSLEERIQAKVAENQASMQAMFLELMKFIKKS